jgi:hypothetical protein
MRPNVGLINRVERARPRAGVDQSGRRCHPTGLFQARFVNLVNRQGIAITHRYGRRGVATAQLDDYRERCRVGR